MRARSIFYGRLNLFSLASAIEALPPSALAAAIAALFQFTGLEENRVFFVSVEIPVIASAPTINPIHLAATSLTSWLSHHFDFPPSTSPPHKSEGQKIVIFPGLVLFDADEADGDLHHPVKADRRHVCECLI